MGGAIASPQPQQVPIPVPAAKTPPTPPTPTAGDSDTTNETIQDEQPQEEISPEDAPQVDQESDSKLPKPEQNPFNKPSIDVILEREMNDDMWRLLRGGLPCLETSAVCLQQLQDRAIAQSPLLKEIDTRIAEANERINEAKAGNKKSIRLAILTPALQYLLGPTPPQGSHRQQVQV